MFFNFQPADEDRCNLAVGHFFALTAGLTSTMRNRLFPGMREIFWPLGVDRMHHTRMVDARENRYQWATRHPLPLEGTFT